MRIIDWSSDVCSSDLAGEIDTGDRGAETAVEGRDGHGHSQILLPKIWPPVPTDVNRPFGTCRWKNADPYAIRCRLDVQVECRVVRANDPPVPARQPGRLLRLEESSGGKGCVRQC